MHVLLGSVVRKWMYFCPRITLLFCLASLGNFQSGQYHWSCYSDFSETSALSTFKNVGDLQNLTQSEGISANNEKSLHFEQQTKRKREQGKVKFLCPNFSLWKISTRPKTRFFLLRNQTLVYPPRMSSDKLSVCFTQGNKKSSSLFPSAKKKARLLDI